jgi:multidrug resistance efflux pump
MGGANMKTARLFLYNFLGILVFVAAGLALYYYIFQNLNYVKTDDAKVWGDLVPLSAAVPGKLTDWKGTIGQTFNQGDVVGRIADMGDRGNITAPINGKIIQSSAVNGQVVAPGQPIATMTDLSRLYILTNIEESRIQDVKTGADVDITVDADPGTTVKGKVEQIGLATNSTFSLLPQQNASGNYTKVVQRIPVRISMSNYPGDWVPGMNATISIHK